MEQIALTRLTVAGKDVLRVLAELDRLPVASRGAFGRFLIDAITEATMAAVCGDMGYSPAEVESIRELWPPPQPLEPSAVS